MPQDRGGLRYTIEVENISAPPIKQFRDDIRAARLEFRAFKTELAGRKSDADRIVREADKMAAASRRAAQAAAKEAQENRKTAVTMNQRSQAVIDANRAYNTKVRADNAAAVSAARNYATERRAASALRQRAQAEDAITKVIEKRRQAELRIEAAKARGISLNDSERKSLGLLSDEQKRLYNAKARLASQQQVAGDSELLRINAETEALRRQNKILLDQEVEKSLQAKGLDKTGQQIQRPQDTGGVKQKIQDFLGLGKAIKSSDDGANRASFTFRRLFGILAAFTIVRTVADLFKQGVVQSVKFNAEIEQAELGIAGVIAAVGTARDATGKLVDTSQALAIAQGEARKQTALLKRDALLTTASFEDLVQAFQTGLAPGLQAGLDVDQVRQFTRQISLAANAIGLDQRQLAEEVRSILTGTIRPQNTRIATALGITNEDIRNAQEAGNLFGFLQAKFKAFDAAGKSASQTLSGLFQRAKDAAAQILGEGGTKLAQDLKGLFAEIVGEVVKLDEATGAVSLDPGLVKVVSLVLDGFRTLVAEARSFKDTLDLGQVQAAARLLGAAISGVSTIIAVTIRGAVIGLAAVSTAISGLFALISKAPLGDKILAIFRTLLVYSAALGTGFVVVGFAIAVMVKAAGLFKYTWAGVLALWRASQIVIRGIAFALAGLNAVVRTIGLSASPLLGTFIALAAAAAAIFLAFDQLRQNPLFDLQNTKVIGGLGDALAGAAARADVMWEAIKGGNPEDRLRGLRTAVENVENLDKGINSLKKDEKPLTQVFADGFEKLGEKIKGVFTLISDEAKKAADDASPDGFIFSQSAALEELKQKLLDIREQVKESRVEMESQLRALGLTGEVAQQVEISERARLEAAKETSKVLAERQLLLKQAANIQAKLDAGAVADAKERETLEGRLLAIQAQAYDLEVKARDLADEISRSKAAELVVLSATQAFSVKQQNATAAIEAANARLLRVYEKIHDTRALDALQAQQELDLARERNKQEDERQRKEIESLRQLIQATEKQRDILAAIDPKERTKEQTAALDTANLLVDTLQKQRDVLSEQADLAGRIRTEEEARLKDAADLAQLKQQDPIGTGIIEAFAQAWESVSDSFQTTLDLMRSAITGFASFVSESLVDAFDPTSDTDIEERFARFLQSLAKQIIETLVTLAITAAVLNAASGGLLGPLLQQFAQVRGFFEGGRAGGRHEGGRAGPSPWRRARGYADGGSPSARGVHGVIRPTSGLHPRDTVPLWADPDEWIIKAQSVQKAGQDAIDRINRGLFNPFELRAAVGLRGGRHSVVSRASSGMGFVAGGRAGTASAMPIPSTRSPSAASEAPPPVAVILPSEDAGERFYRRSRNALLSVLADAGIHPNRR